MRIVNLGTLPARSFEETGSHGLTLAAFGRARNGALAAVFELVPGGEMGLHPVTQRQVLLVHEGRAAVGSGDDESVLDAVPGDAVVWDAGEQMQVRSDEGVVAVLFQGDIDWVAEPAD